MAEEAQSQGTIRPDVELSSRKYARILLKGGVERKGVLMLLRSPGAAVSRDNDTAVVLKQAPKASSKVSQTGEAQSRGPPRWNPQTQLQPGLTDFTRVDSTRHGRVARPPR
jgi:hypothetical protein